MEQNLVIDAWYNEDTREYEVYSIDETTGMKTIMLTQTHEDIIQQLKQMMVKTLQALKNMEDSVKE